jgi:phenylphosphate carboxylase gamma subunit
MNTWEVFVDNLDELPEGDSLELTIRTLNPGLHKYTYKRVTAEVSPSLDQYADRLQVRFGRGQLSDQQFSINVLAEINRFPNYQ